ncbi:unnamed protein product, partial [Rotaria sp. Silwood1]
KTIHVGRPIQYRLKHFGLPANQLKFDLRSNEDSASASLPKEITVADYFALKYKKLQYPHLPCIDARNGEEERAQWLPMEAIVEWEHAMRPLDSVQQALVAKKSIVKSDQRYYQIMNIIHQRNWNSDRYLKALNIQVNTPEMLKIRARILPPPQITYRKQNNQNVVEHVSLGKWKIRNQFCSTPIINKWDVENLSQKINTKIGGINGIVNLKTALSQISNTDRFMFFGVDATHTTSSRKRPSIAAIVGSCNPSCSHYAACLCERK